MSYKTVLEEVEGLYRIIALRPLRRTEGVRFDMVELESLVRIDAIDRVLHAAGAVSPGPVQGVAKPWYMHTSQDDNLLVLHGTRHIDIYTPAHGKVEHFTVTEDHVIHNGKVMHEGAAMLVWPRGVFHRIESDADGSASLNLATHYDGFNIADNFSVYDLNTETGEHRVIREGRLDQP